ncbi:MAG: hypothetical protein JWN47_201 [Frankiales bacterium]|nr:hypothetical protein [Frankiales bacterium]
MSHGRQDRGGFLTVGEQQFDDPVLQLGVAGACCVMRVRYR